MHILSLLNLLIKVDFSKETMGITSGTTPETPLTELRSREFNNGSSEIDMLIGFFLMNGACISNLFFSIIKYYPLSSFPLLSSMKKKKFFKKISLKKFIFFKKNQ